MTLAFVAVTLRRSVAEKIHRTLRKPYQLGDRFATVSVRIGASMFPFDGEDTHSLLSHADAAMYQAKRRARA